MIAPSLWGQRRTWRAQSIRINGGAGSRNTNIKTGGDPVNLKYQSVGTDTVGESPDLPQQRPDARLVLSLAEAGQQLPDVLGAALVAHCQLSVSRGLQGCQQPERRG